MHEGRLDATIMVAYLPQKWWRQEGGQWLPNHEQWDEERKKWQVDCGVLSPRQYAGHIFDQIEQMASRNSDHLAVAHSPADLLPNKLAGRKSILLGIENGLALEGQLENVEHFARRGIVYITLCHNGDNDLCDSAKGSETHGGVSTFGEQVIKEMNRLGILVDLSHAHERTFYDTLAISTRPVVCSHSSVRTLCDHPRNLTDDQMRRLAQQGGVMQVTLYPGFLCSQPSDATILNFMEHLDHAVRLMGIDHVGIGSDFDGDGGVPGLAHAGELLNYTRQLLARRYNEEDIAKLWGGNFLRLL
jgi:microsomal dipeptidase-like Zn-dependent dipeptidase